MNVDERPPVSTPAPARRASSSAARSVLRVVFLVSLAAAPVFVIFPMLGGLLLPAVALIVFCGGLLVALWWHERERAPAGVEPPPAESAASQPPTALPGDAPTAAWTARTERGRRAGGKELVRLASFLGILAAVVAAAVFDWRLLVLGAVLAFAGMALFGMPVWLAAAADADEAARRRRPGFQP